MVWNNRPLFGSSYCTPNMVYSSEQFIKLHGIHRSDVSIYIYIYMYTKQKYDTKKADAIKDVT